MFLANVSDIIYDSPFWQKKTGFREHLAFASALRTHPPIYLFTYFFFIYGWQTNIMYTIKIAMLIISMLIC